MPPDFSRRATDEERMDDPALPAARYAEVLHDLSRVNVVTRAAAPTLSWLARATSGRDGLVVLDVGFGHGDMLRAIARWARRRGVRLSLHGVDINPRSAPIAAAATDPALGITWHTGDARDLALRPDVVVSSLVAHHMADDALVGFLQWMERVASRGWFVNDLQRHPVAWYGYRALAALLRWDPIVRHDGALSVRRAFTRADWDALLARAGIARHAVRVTWSTPFRLCVGRIR